MQLFIDAVKTVDIMQLRVTFECGEMMSGLKTCTAC
jgi:hypothetical protein